MNKRLIRLLILIFFFLLAIFFVWVWYREPKTGFLTVAFLNIGQGDAIYIEAPHGNQLLIDGGPGRQILRELGNVMPFSDRTIDAVIATHPDADHIGGLVDVLDNYEVGLFMEPGVTTDSSLYKTLEEKVAREKTENGSLQKIEARRGMTIDLGDGVLLQILYPVSDTRGWETNDASIVARLVYGNTEFLLTGDAPVKTERGLMYMGPSFVSLHSDVLKVGHHGSKTSTSPEFVAAVHPEYAVISVGKDNRYGHPTPVVLETLKKENIKILRTDTMGRIIFTSDGVNLKMR